MFAKNWGREQEMGRIISVMGEGGQFWEILYIPSWQRAAKPTILGRSPPHPYVAYYPFFKFLPTLPSLPNLPVTSNPDCHCLFCCSVSLVEWVITPHKYGSTHIEPWYLSTRRTLMYVFCNKAPSLLRSDTMWFFTGTWI